MTANPNIFRRVTWFDRREKFDIDYFDVLLPKRKVSSDPRYRSGVFYSEKCARFIQYESKLEYEFILLLESCKRVRFYFEQPVRIPYWRGRKRLRYTPDFGVYLTTGEFVIVEVKDLHGMLEDKVQCKTEGLIDFCTKMGFGLLVTDGRHTIADIKKIKLNRALERLVLSALEDGPIRRRQYAEMIVASGAKSNDILRIILKHDLYYTAFPLKIRHGGYNKVFREIFKDN
ncbi:MAG: hypothetical protein LUF87_01930 [Alistipes sp.]|nr:hypothetical protein [Alistipes sp.]